jgi:hypothetical protein
LHKRRGSTQVEIVRASEPFSPGIVFGVHGGKYQGGDLTQVAK